MEQVVIRPHTLTSCCCDAFLRNVLPYADGFLNFVPLSLSHEILPLDVEKSSGRPEICMKSDVGSCCLQGYLEGVVVAELL